VITIIDIAQQLVDQLSNDGSTTTSVTSIGVGSDGHITSGSNVTSSSIVNVISTVLNITNNCTNIARSSDALTSVINIALSDAVPYEAASTFTSSNVIISGKRTSSTSSSSSTSSGSSTVGLTSSALPTIVSIGGSNVAISAEATSTDASDSSGSSLNDVENDYSDVHVIQYAPSTNVLYCYATNTTNSTDITSAVDLSNNVTTGTTIGVVGGSGVPIGVPLTSITSIDIYNNNGSLVNVKNLSEPITISSTISSSITTLLTSLSGSNKCSTPQPVRYLCSLDPSLAHSLRLIDCHCHCQLRRWVLTPHSYHDMTMSAVICINRRVNGMIIQQMNGVVQDVPHQHQLQE
jgi:hypothetical protein